MLVHIVILEYNGNYFVITLIRIIGTKRIMSVRKMYFALIDANDEKLSRYLSVRNL